MIANMFYFSNINSIGGVESFFYNLACKYEDNDIVIYYKTGDQKQIARLMKHVRVVRYSGEKIVCKKAFFNYTIDIIDNVEAEEYIQIIHADYKKLNFRPATHPKITRYLGVSEVACNSFKELTGIDIELAYNPYYYREPSKVLRLISATRLTQEKGKKRMENLANILDENRVNYIWTIFTDDISVIKNPSIVYRKPCLDILGFIAASDYLVQLSDHEAYCYSVVEALSVGTPVIVTDCPVFKEIGVKDGENGFVLDFSLKNVPVEKIVKGLGRVSYSPIKDSWNDILAPGESQYKEEIENIVFVRVKRDYYDIPTSVNHKYGEILSVPKTRLDALLKANVVDLV